jgi:hypothetical protein
MAYSNRRQPNVNWRSRVTGKGSAAFNAMSHLSADRTSGLVAFRAIKFFEAEVQEYQAERQTDKKGKEKIAHTDSVTNDRKPDQAAAVEKETTRSTWDSKFAIPGS